MRYKRKNLHKLVACLFAAFLVLSLVDIMPAKAQEERASRIGICLANCDNAVDTGGDLQAGYAKVEYGIQNEDGTNTDQVYIDNPAEPVSTGGADAMGVSCSGTCDGPNDSGGRRVDVSYLDSGETGKSEDPVWWDLRVPNGYHLNVEGYQVIIFLQTGPNNVGCEDPDQCELVVGTVNSENVVQGRGLFGSFPGGNSYTIGVTDGAWAIVPMGDASGTNAMADICRRWHNNVGNARDMLFGPPAWGADYCGPIPTHNGETTSEGEPVVVDDGSNDGGNADDGSGNDNGGDTPDTGDGDEGGQPPVEDDDDVQTGTECAYQASGDGVTIRFDAGCTVDGVDIVLDNGTSYMGGQGTGNCTLYNAPSGGTVTTGVINPTEDEIARTGKKCGS